MSSEQPAEKRSSAPPTATSLAGPAVDPSGEFVFSVELDQWVWDAFYSQPGYPPGRQGTQ